MNCPGELGCPYDELKDAQGMMLCAGATIKTQQAVKYAMSEKPRFDFQHKSSEFS